MTDITQNKFLELIQALAMELEKSKKDEMYSADLADTVSSLMLAYKSYLTSSFHKGK